MTATREATRPNTQSIGPVVTEKNDRIAEYKRRKSRLLQKRVASEDVASRLTNGWVVRRKLPKGRVILEKQKVADEVLENRFWCILYQFGFDELNRGRQFQISITPGGKLINKQVAVFAKIDDVVIITECKYSEKKQKISFQADIDDFAALQKPIAISLRKHYGTNSKFKIVWLFVTGNVIWSETDRACAKARNIKIIEERELRYFEEIAKNVGPAAKYQFLGEFLSDQRIPELSNYSVPAIRTKLGGNWAYYFLAPPSRILPVAFVNHRGLRDIESAPAYQRVLKRSRLREIGEYIDNGGFFPNNILLNFKDEVRFYKKTSFEDRQISFGDLYLPDKYKSVWVIDGQHRLFGFAEMDKELDKHTVPVLAFEKLSTENEAKLFVTINSKQQKVARSLLDELAGDLKLDSPDFDERSGATASRALNLMASETGNPFEDRFKTADLADSDTICLTISGIKKAILSAKLLGSIPRNGIEIPGPFSRKTVKRTLNALCDGLTAFFSLIEAANQERWQNGGRGYLCTNIAVQGYVRLLHALIEYMHSKTGLEPNNLDAEELIKQLKPYLEPVLEFVETADDADFTKRFRQPFGSGGPPRYFYQLCLLVRAKYPDFKPTGFSQMVEQQETAETTKGDSLTKSIVDRVHRHVIAVLKVNYGNNDFFDKGIPQKEIKLSAMQKHYDDKNSMPPETYLDVIELKKIMEHKQNWEFFKETMNIKLQDDEKGQAKYLKWIERLNEVRRILAHPSGRSYKNDDIEFLEFVHEQLEARNV